MLMSVRRITIMQLRQIPRCVLVALACGVAGATYAQAVDFSRFPTKPIRLIVPFPPGGSNDILGRFIAQRLSENLGRQTIADNRPGADGIIGTELAARAPADGHTLLIVSTTYTMNPALRRPLAS
jgi:tripartite-type tricarboxylate transporter receptor subunit TctC